MACDFARGEIDPPVASLLQGEDMGMHQKMRSDEEILGSYQGNVPCSMQVPLDNFEGFLAKSNPLEETYNHWIADSGYLKIHSSFSSPTFDSGSRHPKVGRTWAVVKWRLST